MASEHPFAQYVRILGRGPNLSRALTEHETSSAVQMLMSDSVEPVQLGAFLCLLRVKTETPQEVAGFVRGVHPFIKKPQAVAADIDWPTYAGKTRQLPWYLLSALLLAEKGVRIFMHGSSGHTTGRLYASEALKAMGITQADSMDQAASSLKEDNFAFLDMGKFLPRLHEILFLRSLLGVRSPVHTVARQINPLNAPYQMLSVTHPPYKLVHRDAAVLLGQNNMVVFKGEGGEAELRPTKPVDISYVRCGHVGENNWPVFLRNGNQRSDDSMDPTHLRQVWRGEITNEYATAAVIGTTAIVLWLLGRVNDPDSAKAMAANWWAGRNLRRISS